ncbi:Serine/threonine-protein phosphatase 5 [Hibiscus syriacus]|uniref:protein-serine/threonine phosphatase n=1 Tax=Hibiscus syriacus TaxID=106335 RepID=A0A6A3BRH1_HIBSY|nr:Serine/threonine-protein phosphatase 5 [Hibiscus syriacus]
MPDMENESSNVSRAEEIKNQANEAFKAHKYGQAIDLYTQAIELNCQNAIYWANRSFAHTKLEEYGSAIQDATKAIEGYYRRGAAYLAMGKFKEALKDFQEVKRICPNDPDATKRLKECEKAVMKLKFEEAISVPESERRSVADSIDYHSISARIEGDVVTSDFVKKMMNDFKNQKCLHKRYAFQIVLQMREMLQALPSLVDINVPDRSLLTVCGDVHGQFYDLINIFELNGLPSEENPYLFNGDFVDRGSFSVEVILTLFAFKCMCPSGEIHFQHYSTSNFRLGLYMNCVSPVKEHYPSTSFRTLTTELLDWRFHIDPLDWTLPKLIVSSAIYLARGNHESKSMNKIYGFEGEKVFVIHGGLFSVDGVKLSDIRAIDRFCEPPEEGLMCELLWSDPQPYPGRGPSKRGVDLVVRSHEVKDEGYEIEHDGKLITVFSAPNYCDQPHPDVKPMAYANTSSECSNSCGMIFRNTSTKFVPFQEAPRELSPKRPAVSGLLLFLEVLEGSCFSLKMVDLQQVGLQSRCIPQDPIIDGYGCWLTSLVIVLLHLSLLQMSLGSLRKIRCIFDRQQDKLLASWLFTTVSMEVLPHLTGLTSSRTIWNVVSRLFGVRSSAKISSLRHSLHSQRKVGLPVSDYLAKIKTICDLLNAAVSLDSLTEMKVGLPVSDYLAKIKTICDLLNAAGCVVPEQEQVSVILVGLSMEFESIIAITSRDVVSLDSLTEMLLDCEARQKTFLSDGIAANMVVESKEEKGTREVSREAIAVEAGEEFTGVGNEDQSAEQWKKPVEQIVPVNGHAYSHTVQSPVFYHYPSSSMHGMPYVLTHQGLPYSSSQVMNTFPGDYETHPAKTEGQESFVHTAPTAFVSTVPRMAAAHSAPNHSNALWYPETGIKRSYHSIQTLTILLRGKLTREGLYQLLPYVENKSCCMVNNVSKASSSLELWHKRLGHSCVKTVKDVMKMCNVSSSENMLNNVCSVCLQGKAHKLSFCNSLTEYKEIFQLVVSDVWGPAPVVSTEGYAYYVSFIDVFSRHTWVYLIRKKSEVSQCFLNLVKIAKVQFGKKIKALQSDGGGEYQALKSWFFTNGVQHRISCPSTSEQNGKAERKHHHIVEMGLAMLAQASLPIKLWSHAFTMAVYIINMFPSEIILGKTPFELPIVYNKRGAIPLGNHNNAHGVGVICNDAHGATSSFAHGDNLGTTPLGAMQDNAHDRGTTPLGGMPDIVHEHGVTPFELTTVHNNTHGGDDTGATNNNGADHYMCESNAHAHGSSENGNSHGVQYSVAPNSNNNGSSENESSRGIQGESCKGMASGGGSPVELSNDMRGAHGFQGDCRGAHGVQGSYESVANLNNNSSAAILNNNDSDASSHGVQKEMGTAETCVEVQPGVGIDVPQPVSNVHPMMTRSKHGIWKPKVYNVASSDREPTNITEALMSPLWKEAAQAEYDALVRNGTWTLVPLPRDRKVISCKWIFRIKRNADGSVSRYKTRLVAKGFLQKPGIDFDEVFSPAVKPATIRVIISLALSRGWKLRQIDVNNAFLNGLLTEEVYMNQPPGYEQENGELVCKLHKAIYGLKQAPRAWFERLKAYLESEGFCLAKSDASLYVRKTSDSLVYLLVYVDDIIVKGDKEMVVQNVIDILNAQFSLKDLGPLSFFLGVEVSYEAKEGTPLADDARYRSIVGALQYIVITRPDVAFTVNRVCQFMQAPLDVHFLAVKRILRYLQGTVDFGLRFTPSSRMALAGFADANWGSDIDDRRSTSGFCIYFCGNLVSWSSKKQQVVARSTAEAEYRSVACAAAEMVWLRSLLGELHIVTHGKATLWCDNTSAVAVCANPVLHSKFKNVELDLFFVREMVAMGQLQVHEVPAAEQVADVLTKPLSASLFFKHRQRLLVAQLKNISD